MRACSLAIVLLFSTLVSCQTTQSHHTNGGEEDYGKSLPTWELNELPKDFWNE